ncbi:MAG: hypothetical protein HOC93_07675 [Phycisphaerae bacterium]|jgi:hypothetical protein|nr:hypothetical protein [Phycisphaerae bacterium]
MKYLISFAIALTTALASGNPAASNHGKVVTKEGVRNPHLGAIVQHGSSNNPKVTITSPHGPVRVDTADGPVFINQIGPNEGRGEDGRGDPYPKCLLCHADIENVTKNMAGMNLYCDFCHGGDPFGETIEDAHIFSDGTVDYNETNPPIDQDLEYQKFINPSNLRVVESTCGMCHPDHVVRVKKSLMATTAGHFAGGLYLNDVQDTKNSIYGNFAIEDTDGDVPIDEGAVESLIDLLIYTGGDPTKVSTHYAAVPSQACARCHLWSRGRGYRGAGEFENVDGTYRADGCAACHMMYSNTGLSESADMSISHTEGGHPKTHVISKQIPKEQCIHCHHRGARIGLSFTGRAQMPPRLPSGPGVPGTTDELFNKNYHYTVDDTNPQDVHSEAGMHCIDCHTDNGIHGDGNIYGHMDQATKIECQTCHGMPTSEPTLRDNDGISLTNVVQKLNGDFVLTSKVDGVEHTIPTAIQIVKNNPNAACAMNDNHLKADGGLECYSCHTSWLPNCFGCHFERDETQMGLNYVTGAYEVGKVTTNNKIFEALRHFSLGGNSEGRIAPYIVGCHPIADVTAPDGSKILDFVMPVTSNGLSGLGHNPVQPHTVRGAGEVRTCAECHRSPTSLGLGSGLFSIARNSIYSAGESGARIYDRYADPDMPVPDGNLLVEDTPLSIASKPDVVEGTADYLYVAQGNSGLLIYDRNDINPDETVMVLPVTDAIDVARGARYLYVVDAGVGVSIYDNDSLETTQLAATVSIPNAQRVVPWGIYLFVPSMNDGLVIVNIADNTAPYIAATVDNIVAADVFVFSHYQIGNDFAVRAYVADPTFGVHVVDLLPDIEFPLLVNSIDTGGAVAVDVYTRWVLANEVEPSREHDYLYVCERENGLSIYDITNPDGIYYVSQVNLGGLVVDVEVVSQLAPPGVDDYAVVANADFGLQMVDVSDPLNPIEIGTVPDANGINRVFVEVQQMDKFLSEQGGDVKENSHPFINTLTREDIVRILSAPIDCEEATCPTDVDGDGQTGINDLLVAIDQWGACYGPCSADVDGDGFVGIDDLLAIVGGWGLCE